MIQSGEHVGFVGNADVVHVAQPADTEVCFAACVASLVGGEIEQVHRQLVDRYISDDDGSTAPPFGTTSIEILGKQISIEPVQGYADRAEDPLGLIERIDGSLVQGDPVVLLYKKTADPEDPRHHWVLLTGYSSEDSAVTSVGIMDPQADRVQYVDPLEVICMIERTPEVFAYSLIAHN